MDFFKLYYDSMTENRRDIMRKILAITTAAVVVFLYFILSYRISKDLEESSQIF